MPILGTYSLHDCFIRYPFTRDINLRFFFCAPIFFVFFNFQSKKHKSKSDDNLFDLYLYVSLDSILYIFLQRTSKKGKLGN